MHTESLRGSMIRELLEINFGILDFLYREWLDREDSFYMELKEYGCRKLEVIPEEINLGMREEGKDGTKPDQAA